LPVAWPLIMAGTKLGAGLWLFLIAIAEMIGAQSGIGYMIWTRDAPPRCARDRAHDRAGAAEAMGECADRDHGARLGCQPDKAAHLRVFPERGGAGAALHRGRAACPARDAFTARARRGLCLWAGARSAGIAACPR